MERTTLPNSQCVLGRENEEDEGREAAKNGCFRGGVLHFHPLGRAFGNYVKAQHGLTGVAGHLQQQQHQAFSSGLNVFITAAPPGS